jgi:hypothetical protein
MMRAGLKVDFLISLSFSLGQAHHPATSPTSRAPVTA